MTLPIGFKPLLGSKTQTFTVNSGGNRQYDMHIAYISSLVEGGKELRVKPLNWENIECLNDHVKISESHSIIGIENREGGIHLKLHEGRSKEFVGPTLKISVINKEKITPIGYVTKTSTVRDDKNLIGIFCCFLRVAQKAHAKLHNK